MTAAALTENPFMPLRLDHLASGALVRTLGEYRSYTRSLSGNVSPSRIRIQRCLAEAAAAIEAELASRGLPTAAIEYTLPIASVLQTRPTAA